MLDLQKLILRRLLETADSDLYSKTINKYFTGSNLDLYSKIEKFYRENIRLPSLEEFKILKKDISLQDYYETQILAPENFNNNVENKFLIAQLQDQTIRYETIEAIDDILNNLEDLEKDEIIDKLQTTLLDLNKVIPSSDELIDVGLTSILPKEDAFIILPSGLSSEYDSVNGGFALQEYIAIGGRRGSGKSIIALNLSLKRFLMGHTVGFFSIEMRYLEVYYRTLSIISGVPFLNFMRNILTKEEKYKAAKAKMITFYKYEEGHGDRIDKWLEELKNTGDLTEFDSKIKIHKPELKDNRFFIIDDPSLTLNRIDHYCNLFYNKFPKFTMGTVDYLNIIKVEDSKDWKVQITLAENIKGFSRKYNTTMISPYQVDATLEARYAKGILDSADRAFVFAPSDPTDQQNENKLTMYTAKIRNGKNITFDIGLDWNCVRIDQNMLTDKINMAKKLLNGPQYGTGKEEGQAKDI